MRTVSFPEVAEVRERAPVALTSPMTTPNVRGITIDSEHFERLLRQNPDVLLMVYDLIRFGPGGRAINHPVPSTHEMADHLARHIQTDDTSSWPYRLAAHVHNEEWEALRSLWHQTMERVQL